MKYFNLNMFLLPFYNLGIWRTEVLCSNAVKSIYIVINRYTFKQHFDGTKHRHSKNYGKCKNELKSRLCNIFAKTLKWYNLLKKNEYKIVLFSQRYYHAYTFSMANFYNHISELMYILNKV